MSAELDPKLLFAGCEGLTGLVLAVSGGPDSVALMLLAAQWRDVAPKVRISVATVDHGLRRASEEEARQVGRWAQSLQFDHVILPWLGEKPRATIQERAREARYGLLFAHAERVGAEAVATAHHADDQWETVLFRLARGSGLAGLAGMARDQLLPGGRVIRPLLSLPKQALIDVCRAKNHEFLDDPSNADPAYARTRLRALAAPLQDLGFSREMAAKLAERARKAHEALGWAAAQCLDRAAISPDAGVYDLTEIENVPLALFERALALAFARLSGSEPRRLDRLEIFALRLYQALKARRGVAATLSGCAARLDQKGRLTLTPEGPRRRGRAAQA